VFDETVILKFLQPALDSSYIDAYLGGHIRSGHIPVVLKKFEYTVIGLCHFCTDICTDILRERQYEYRQVGVEPFRKYRCRLILFSCALREQVILQDLPNIDGKQSPTIDSPLLVCMCIVLQTLDFDR